MLIRNKGTFNVGLILSVTFLGVLALIFSPIFGGKNGLEYSDALFNKLAKGSSYFIPKINESVKKFDGKTINVTMKLEKPEQAASAAKMLGVVGATGEATDNQLSLTADVGKLLTVILKDSDSMYNNNGAELKTRYGMDEREAMSTWWVMLKGTQKELQKAKSIEEANVVAETMKKGIEPAFNFYQVEAQNIGDKAFTVLGLLVFYVVYTLWWGFAIFYVFDGIGLSMKKAKVRKEA